MIHLHDIMRERLLRRAGLAPVAAARHTLDQLAASQWSPEFERFMRNRLIMGALRYGLIGSTGKPRYDRLAGIEKRMSQYRQTGNLEFLVDVANLALLEFVEGEHPLKHWAETHDDHCGIRK